MNAWGGLNEFLPWIFARGDLTMFLVKKYLKKIKEIKYGFEGSISDVILACFSQTTNLCLVS